MLDSLTKFMFDNIGNICSSTKISNTMTSMGRSISVHTVENYLKALLDSFILYKVERYDIKGKEYYQVAYTVQEETVLKREITPLDNISDHNPKYLLTMDDEPEISHNGIKQINVLEWLLNEIHYKNN